ncbi:AMP-binding enzyme [Hoylesella marshii]|uniref:AMP-binding enzyme n=1 Tax=Hoylesella marshii TaxID=189722 RepID=UPI0035ABE1B4
MRSSWAMNGRKSRWQSTGDLAFRNNEGYYFHRGRADGMVVCGGENVYPSHVEHVLMGHPHVIAARVYPVPHPAFGQVLHAQVELQNGLDDTPEMLKSWLDSRLSRAEMPHHITMQAIELLSTGKPKR